MAKDRENFASGLTAVMAMAGSAIGLGNIWRFPYMVGQHGGAAFVLIYVVCVLLLSLPILMAESVIGRSTHAGTFGAMHMLAPGTPWKWLGFLTVFSPLIILSFYSVVGGWSIRYLFQSLVGFDSDVVSSFGSFVSAPGTPLLFHTAFLAVTALVVLGGVKSGIERFNNISLPVLFVLIVVIAVYSMTLPGAIDGVRYLVKPDFSCVNSKVVAYAMGQSFFSLSLGVGTILTYSSYIRREESLIRSGLGTAVFDLFFAMLAGFAIMPAVFAAGIEPGAGPGLIFETLPFIFVKMGVSAPVLSYVVAVLFFLTIVMAALTSSISMYEVGVAYLVEERGYRRGKAVLVIFLGTWVLGALCSLSFGPLSDMLIMGKTVFDFCDALTANFLMTFGALLFVLFVGWKMDKAMVRDEICRDGDSSHHPVVFKVVYFLIRYVAPVAILAIFLTNLVL